MMRMIEFILHKFLRKYFTFIESLKRLDMTDV